MRRRIDRLRDAKAFATCYRRGRVAKNGYVVVHAVRNSDSCSRVGYSVSKKVGNAVQRNRIKRRLRECVQSVGPRVLPGFDIVISARVRAKDAPYASLSSAVGGALARLGLFEPPDKREATDV